MKAYLALQLPSGIERQLSQEVDPLLERVRRGHPLAEGVGRNGARCRGARNESSRLGGLERPALAPDGLRAQEVDPLAQAVRGGRAGRGRRGDETTGSPPRRTNSDVRLCGTAAIILVRCEQARCLMERTPSEQGCEARGSVVAGSRC